MALEVGTRLGHYDVNALLGEGGMGQVWQATDTQLNREVALKILPDAFAADPDRLARFKREAQILASLNHPNIAAIYGIEEAEGTRAIVLELVEGPTLAERIRHGPIPLDEALPIAKQIAEVLEAAHEAGVIHRDVKPANVKVKADGTVKVLDFGLAKAFQPDASDPNMSMSPTISLTAAATQMGMVIGTAAYMSPEQAKGRPVDKRADVWAFGAVVYEMLTGQRPFSGDDVSEILARVIDREPDWSAFASTVPHVLTAFLRRCLEKDPKRRVRDIGDVRMALEGAFESPSGESETVSVAAPASHGWRQTLPIAFTTLVVGALLSGLAVWKLTRPGPRRRVRLVVSPGSTAVESSGIASAMALSPDGTTLVYSGSSDGVTQLFRRSLDQFGVAPIPDTVNGRHPFFSPDGQWMGFDSDGVLKKVRVVGGPPVTVCECAGGSASWGSGRIVLGELGPGLAWVAVDGGTPDVLTIPDRTKGEQLHRWPSVLPGGEAVLFTVATNNGDTSVAVLSLETRQWTTVIDQGQQAQYVRTGHLVFARGETLFAVGFDLAQLAVTGSPAPVVEAGRTRPPFNLAQFTVSDAGALAYAPPAEDVGGERRLVWVNRQGDEEVLPIRSGSYAFPRLSPDGQRVALTVGDVVGDRDIWIFDVAGTPPIPLTSKAENAHPIWTPDGDRVVFDSTSRGDVDLVWMPADGSVFEPEVLLTSEVIEDATPRPLFWTPDGRELVFSVRVGIVSGGIWAVSRDGERPRPVVRTEFYEGRASLSPNGRWLAYVSSRTGDREVWLQAYDGAGAPRRVSDGGGLWPTWAPDGRELDYLNGDQMMAHTFDEAGSGFEIGASELVFDQQYFHPATGPRNYDVSPDGRFLMLRGGEGRDEIHQFHVVLDWFDELTERVPVR